MKKCLFNEEQKILKSNNGIVKFDYDHYIDACKSIAEEIKKNYNLERDNVTNIGNPPLAIPINSILSLSKL